MAISSIKEPVSIVMNKELALISCINTLFLKLRHLLCRWYMNINVLIKTKKHFPGLIKNSNRKVKRHPFLSILRQLEYATF